MDSIELITSKIIQYLESNNISNETELNLAKKLKIVSQVKKEIAQVKEFVEEMKNMDNSERINKVLEILMKVLNSEEIKKVLSEQQINELKNVVEDAEILETIVDMIEFVYEEVKEPILENMDENKDGVVTRDEVMENMSCCGNKRLASCWAGFYLKFLCCGNKNQVVYKDQNDEKDDKEEKKDDLENVTLNV